MGEQRTVEEVLAGEVERVRISFDARQTGPARATATVHLVGEDQHETFYANDVTAVARWLGEKGVAEPQERTTESQGDGAA